MTISTASSISSLDISSTDARYTNAEAQGVLTGIEITAPTPDLKRRRLSSDSVASVDSLHTLPKRTLPSQRSTSELAGVQVARCTCICPTTGTAYGPPCRLCRTVEYNLLQEGQARKKRRHDRLRSITSALSSKLSALSHTFRWSKRRQPSITHDQTGLHAKKDSVISWPESEDTYIPDVEAEGVESDGKLEVTHSERKESVSSRIPKLSLRNSFNKGFARIPDTEEEKEAKRAAKRQREEESRQREQDHWYNEQGQLDWRVMMAAGGVIW